MRELFSKQQIVIIAAWLVVQILLLWKHGIVTHGEAEKYISEANSILTTGKTISPDFWLYSVQSWLITIDKFIGAEYFFAISVQLAVNLWSTFRFHHLLKRVVSHRAAFLSTVLLIFNFPYQQFNTFLQTESLYFSFVIIFTSYLLTVNRIYFTRILTVVVFLILLSLTRPPGLLYIPPLIVYIYLRFPNRRNDLRLALTTLVVLSGFVTALTYSMNRGGRFHFMRPFITEQVICLVPETTVDTQIRLASNPNTLYGLAYYVVHNPVHFSKLAVKRGAAFFGLLRSHFSIEHNIFLFVFFYPLYAGCLLSLPNWFRDNPAAGWYLIMVIVIVLITTLLTCDDWHNRFFLSISPLIILMASPAIQRMFEIYDSKSVEK